MIKTLEIYIDGACQGNPGRAAIGVVIHEKGKRLKRISKTIGESTNNAAEYSAFIHALEEALSLKAQKISIHTDSELLFNQVRGRYKVRSSTLKNYFDQARHLLGKFDHVELKQIPREQNKEADKLASEALSKEKQSLTWKLKNSGEKIFVLTKKQANVVTQLS